MKKLLITAVLSISSLVFSQKTPEVLKTEFSAEALSQSITSFSGKKTTVKQVLAKHKGKVLIIDFWASWCKDCILALPKTKELIEKNPKVKFVYFSLDRSSEQWKKGLTKYEISDKENYWFDEGWKNKFNNYIDLNWVPRFIVVDQKGKIAKYYAISPEDPEIQSTIDTLLNNKK